MKKRSKYRPKGVRLDVMAWIKAGMLPVSAVNDAATTLKIKNHSALAAVVQGNGTRDDVEALIGFVNIAEALAMRGKGIDWFDEIKQGTLAVRDMARRGLERGKFIFTGPEMKAINLAMEIHDAQLDNCTVKELEDALHFVSREIQLKRAEAIA